MLVYDDMNSWEARVGKRLARCDFHLTKSHAKSDGRIPWVGDSCELSSS